MSARPALPVDAPRAPLPAGPSLPRLLAGFAAVGAYLLVCWWLMGHAADRPWAVAVIFGPWLLPLVLSAWQRRQPLLGALAAAGGALLLWISAHGGLGDVRRLYLAQHALVHAALGVAFASTLLPGRMPLITAMAWRVHRDASPVAAYTRKLTAVWAAYLLGMALSSVLVYRLMPFEAWAVLANVVTPVSLVALFVGEFAMRYRWHPEFERIGLRDMIRAAQAQPAIGAAPPEAGR